MSHFKIFFWLQLSACKQKLEKEMDEVRQQLHHSDQLLKAKESKENNQKKKLEVSFNK